MKRNSDPLEVVTPDGVRLGGRIWRPEGLRARGTVVALHAMMVDHRSLDRPTGAGFASHLALDGWRVVAGDFRGRSGEGPGDWTYADLVYRDVPTWVARARREGGGPVFVVGHSLGGHITAAALASGVVKLDGLLLVAANVWLPQAEPALWRRGLKRAVVEGFAGLAAGVGRFPARGLGIGPCDESRSYARDLARPMRAGDWSGGRQRVDWWWRWGQVGAPVSAWLASGDRWLAERRGASAFASPAGAEVHVVGGGGAGVEENPGHMEILTDPRSAPAWSAMSAWMARTGGV